MKNARVALTVLLIVLVLFKGLLAIQGEALSLGLIPLAAMYAGLFGSPQLIWISMIQSAKSAGQIRVGCVVAFIFLVIYQYCGFFPGMHSPSSGSEGHFEVPLAFLAEWFVALLFMLPYKSYANAKNKD